MKHKELIIAWANGAQIQVQDAQGRWQSIGHPIWDVDSAYRIKPEPKPDTVRYYISRIDKVHVYSVNESVERANVKLTFDSATGALKSAEVIKC
jgi:hypothetical protein